MAYITQWITNIILLILFAAILELLLPNSSLQRYVKLVVGLMVLMVMIQPILTVFKTDPEDWLSSVSEWVDGDLPDEETSIERKKVEIEKGRLAYISEQVAVQMRNEAKEPLKQQFGLVPQEVTIELEEFQENENILAGLKVVRAVLAPAGEEAEEEVNAGQADGITPVETVVIHPVGDGSSDEKEDAAVLADVHEVDEITAFLSVQWQIPSENILLELKGGGEDD
ncbi:stage III sporulation protein AF [Bacillus sp. H-16]|uniref:stage III sporulation protein AF n=1 Tax=Alteribacter salitolerans TaxID=2912333 RepID=UPI001962D3B1|nr:stage III sporulation protein AF [Alteribacter salitolerans]MBM7097289.1 stage III sporulation protein AF [Alteribacter salitolerans]